jgi:tetratricopeptide (TPR) repeat protein
VLAVSHTVRTIAYVLTALAFSLMLAGFASSAYHRERSLLGSRHFRSGSWSAGHGQLADAVDQFRKALLFAPDEEQYRLALAESLVRLNYLPEAQGHLEQLADEDPSNGRVNYLLGEIAEKRGNRKLAIERCQRAVYEYWPPEEIPERRQVRWHLVRLLEAANRPNEVVGELIQLNASAPDAKERSIVGFELLKYGALSEAGRIFRDLEANSPKDAGPHRGLGEVYFGSGDYISARHEFIHARRVDPNDQESTQWLALTNAVVDLDPLLPGINAAERLRRSQNLLTRVVHLLTTCSPGVPGDTNAVAELGTANQLLNAKKHSESQADDMQQSAVQLWRDRGRFCKAGPVTDKAVETAIARVASE